MGKVMSRESMERYSKGVGSCGRMADAEMRASLKEYLREHPDAGVEDLRNFCIRRIGEIGGFYGGAAQQLAETMLAEVSEINGYAAPRLDGYVYSPDMERVDGDVRYLMEKWKDGDGRGFVDAVCATARANAEFGANATMAHAAARQAERNGKKGSKRKGSRGGGRKQASALRFARVPMGGKETCDFCIMLASRGFVYHTKESAGELMHYHANCACRIVPGFEGDRVEGYDPDYYYGVWKHPEDHPEVRDARNARRRELYREKHPRENGGGGAPPLRASSGLVRYEGDFGGATKSIRKAYADAAEPPASTFAKRTGAALETQGDFSALGSRQHSAIYSGMEHACGALGYDPGNIRLLSAEELQGAYAQARRRSGGITVHLDTKKLAKLSEDEIEQIVFHEIAHGKEYEGLTDAQFAKEAARLIKFQRGDAAKLPASTASKRLEKCLLDAGIQAMYKPFDGKISFSGVALKELRQLPEYAWKNAFEGTQDSELIAESLRFVANNGYGVNRIADAIAGEFGGGSV